MLWQQVEQKLPCFGFTAFDHVFREWERVPLTAISASTTLKKSLVWKPQRLVVNMDLAQQNHGSVFQEIRLLKAGRMLMEWCSFEHFNDAWQGCATALNKARVEDFKFISEVLVVFQFCSNWMMPTKVLAFVTTAQWTGFRYNCAQSFDVDCPPHGFDAQGSVVQSVRPYFDCIIEMARTALKDRSEARKAKHDLAEAKRRAKKQAILDAHQ